nr:CIC_HP1_G0046820.mRNA.1.CDS.1 [Saccharomyces cerevisiae]
MPTVLLSRTVIQRHDLDVVRSQMVPTSAKSPPTALVGSLPELLSPVKSHESKVQTNRSR